MQLELLVLGLSYRTAPVDVREKLAFPEDALAPALGELGSLPSVGEAVLLSTCNRVEIYAAARPGGAGMAAAAAELRRFFASSRQVSDEALARHLYEHAGVTAIKHVFRVAASLDSLVLGEPQILGQLKTAYGVAARAGSVGPLLGRCLERAFKVAKRVRSETAIARGAGNVSTVAVELAKRVFGELHGRKVLVVGAGKMSALAARHLYADGSGEILVTNRSPGRAAELAKEVGGTPRPWAELEALLGQVDVVISSTGAPEPVITRSLMRSVMKARRHKAIFMVDIAVPRDVQPEVAKIDGVYLFDIDDLERVAAGNRSERQKEAGAAEQIVDGETADFVSWLRAQGVVPTIKGLRERFQKVAQAEVERTLASLGAKLDDKSAQSVRQLADTIVGKLLHTPLTALKQVSGEDAELLVTAARRLFALTEPELPAMAEEADPEKKVAP